ncbi:Ubiquitinyl hydrolase 1 [Bertholletia excelsa]
MKIEGNVDILSLIQKFQQGVKAWPQVKFVFAPVFRISLAGLLGVAGLIFTLRDGNIRNFSCSLWSSGGQKSFEKLWIVPGLQNFGNNCFLNVILQALASCSGFQTFLEATVEECESSLGGEWAEGFPLTFALVSLMEGGINSI